MSSHGVPRASAVVEQTPQARAAEKRKIDEYKDLVEQVNSKIKQREYTPDTLTLISRLLKRNPEYYTIWNYRRRVLQHFFSEAQQSELPLSTIQDGASVESATSPDPTSDAAPAQNPNAAAASEQIESLIVSDLHFLVPLLREFPKCYWMWNHRHWLLQEATRLLPVLRARRLWQEELGLVAKMLSLDSRNFHGWGYRREVVAELESQALQGTSMAEDEFSYTTKMIKTSLSNFSAWHYRSKLIPKLLHERAASREERKKFLDSEFNLIQTALWTDSADQSLWFYHAFLMSELIFPFSSPLSSTSTSTSTSPASTAHIVPDLTASERVVLISRELDNLEEMLEDFDDGNDEDQEQEQDAGVAPAERKYIYQALVTYTLEKYKWERIRQEEEDEGEEVKKRERKEEVQRTEKKYAIDKKEVSTWLHKLQVLDPFRMGRWEDIKRELERS